MVTALRPGPFIDSSCKKPALNMNEMKVRAAKFMRLEKFRDFGEQMKEELHTEKVRTKKRTP